jgi:hypothetical protein
MNRRGEEANRDLSQHCERTKKLRCDRGGAPGKESASSDIVLILRFWDLSLAVSYSVPRDIARPPEATADHHSHHLVGLQLHPLSIQRLRSPGRRIIDSRYLRRLLSPFSASLQPPSAAHILSPLCLPTLTPPAHDPRPLISLVPLLHHG